MLVIKDLTITSFLKSIFTFTLEINYTNATSVTKDSLIEVACEICGDGFISSNHLKRHMKTHSNHLPFACGTYKQAFSQRRQLVSHCEGKVMLQAHKFQEHHENPDFETSSFPEDKFACRVCLKLLTRNSDVKAHILRVHCGDCRYPCTMCGKRFKESTHLRKHLYTHTGERPRYCSLSVRKVFRQALI